jgi:C4-dicarboxylate transporter, DctM subunit
MDPFMVGLVGFTILILLVLLGTPIAVALGIIGIVGVGYLLGISQGLNILRTTPYLALSDYSLSVIPLFLMMGAFCHHSGISRMLFKTVYTWMGQLRGGLAMASVGASGLFAAVSGSSMATVATIGEVALPEMRRYKYDSALAVGVIAAGGTLGILIPPSVTMIIYAIITQQSVGKMFIAGIIPGFLEIVFYIITISIWCYVKPNAGPSGPRTTFQQKIFSLGSIWPMLVLFMLIMGGIYGGIFSPTEAGAVGAFGALLFTLGMRKLTKDNFSSVLLETGKNASMVILIIVSAKVFGNFLAVSRLPFDLAEIIVGLNLNRYIILAAILIVYVFLGLFMLPMPMIIITVPIIFPIIIGLGFNPIWFGILMVRIVEIGQITPPVGVNLFVMKAIAKDVPTGTLYKGVIPFFIADIFHVALLIAVPQLSLFLPNLMG